MAEKTAEKSPEKTADELKRENAKLRNIIDQQKDALAVAEATKGKNAKPTVVVNGKHYLVLAGERRAGQAISREELAKDTERCAELVAQGSGLLTPVVINAPEKKEKK